ncbi:MAG: DUF922 domain-containing protein [Rhizobiaceae bacterium]
MASILPSSAKAGNVSVSQHTRTYRVSGETIQAVVKSMKRNGPQSELHGRRALGMADYRFRTSLKTVKKGSACHVENAKVTMRISYVLPRLVRPQRLRSSHQSRWRRIHSMIRRHEDQHGRYYRLFANQLQRSLAAIPPQRSCAAIRKLEKQIKKRLEKASVRRNRRFDRAQYRPFNRRLKQLAPKRRTRR